MKTSIKIGCLAVIVACSGMVACHSRTMTRFDVHPERDLVLVETFETTSVVWAYQNEHVMWSCKEDGDVLNCKRSCGGDTEQLCPKTAIISAEKKKD